jgi:hypothetical protein
VASRKSKSWVWAFESPPIQWEEGGQLLNMEAEVWGRHGDEGILQSLSTWIWCRASHKIENGTWPDRGCRKEAVQCCKDESKGNDATCSVFQHCFTIEQVELQKRRDKINWPTRKAHHIMLVIVKEYKPEDAIAKMEIERALAKLKLRPNKEPNELLNKFTSIKCWYSMELSESKKKAQILQFGGTWYLSIIVTTLVIHHKIKTTLTAEKLLDEMHTMAHGRRKVKERQGLQQRGWNCICSN